MIWRLVVHVDNDREQTFELDAGAHTIGSAEGCTIRVLHPVISRRHAQLALSNEGVSLVDLGSRNGTWADGARVGSRRLPLQLPADLGLGTIRARIERIPDQDVEAAIRFDTKAPVRRDPVQPAVTTASLGDAFTFLYRELPEVVGWLAGGAEAASFVPRLGAALFDRAPCARLEIRSASGGVLFCAERTELDGATTAAAASGPVEAVFLHPGHARAWRPVLATAAHLVDLVESRTSLPSPPDEISRPPPYPDPPTVVPTVRAVYDEAARLAASDLRVLIRGESGTGKELLARYIHDASPLRDRPFVALNCAALPSGLLEAELFGVELGAATGVAARAGRFELADGGTLFLDEIGDMHLDTQAKILRVLEQHEIYRVGATAPRPARARVVAATNRDIDALLERGDFRRDLYHRIADWQPVLPPLRERSADIPNLAAFFLRRETERRGVSAGGLSRGAIDRLMGYSWPGNIRELEREIARASLALRDGQLLESRHLQVASNHVAGDTLKEQLEAAERAILVNAISAHGGGVAAAARSLGIGRSTLYRRLKELDVNVRTDED